MNATVQLASADRPQARRLLEVPTPEGCDARLFRRPLLKDERGAFGRTWCLWEMDALGIDFRPVQGNLSTSSVRGTVRGMHLQRPPMAEAKLVRCTRGVIFDVVTDLRPKSANLGRSFTFELSQDDPTSLFVPEGFAHGFQSLTDDAHVEYVMGQAYSPDHADGFRYDDPATAIDWPLPIHSISAKDLSWPDLSPRLGELG